MSSSQEGDISIKVTNYGARIVSVILPDKNGKVSLFWFYF